MFNRFLVVIVVVLFYTTNAYSQQAIATSEYNLEVSFDIPASKITGIARINASAGKEIIFYTGKLKIHNAILNNQRIEFASKNGVLKVLPYSSGLLEIGYEGVFKDERIPSEFNYGVVQNMVSDVGISLTDTWYPYIDGLKRYSLKVSLPNGYEAVSEAEEIKKIKKDGITEFVFYYPHLVDKISLVSTNRYEIIKDSYNNIDIYAYFFKEDINLAKTYIDYTKKYLALYEGLIGKYPFKRFSIVENFLPSGYSMPTYTLLGQDVVRLPFIVETSLGHEVLHQWFGNLVYIDYEKGNWAEGITTYLADHLYEEQKGKGWDYRKQILINYMSYVAEKNEFPLKDFKMRADLPSRAIGYGKASMVFHMLKGIVGEDIFYKSLKDIVNKQRFTKASWDDIKSVFEENYKKELNFFFSQWIENKGVPELNIENVKIRQVGNKFELSFNILQKTQPYVIDVPIRVYYLTGEIFQDILKINSETNSFKILLDNMPERIVIDEDYDIARRLQIQEFPPVIARLLGDERLTIVLPEQEKEIYTGVIDMFKKENTLIKEADEIKYSDMNASSFLILSLKNPLIKKIYAKIESNEAGFSVAVKENPWNPEKVIGIIDAKSIIEANVAYKKVPHYGKYSYISFDEGKNISKKIEKTIKGIQKEVVEDSIAIEISTLKTLKEIIDELATKKIIYVGELHDRFSHHNVQLQVIKGLHSRGEKIAIGMEMFQRTFQKVLDDYIAGSIDERDFLIKSEYFKRWGFDYNLYKPIIDFAKNKKIPIIALNLQREIIHKVSKGGIDSLSDEEKKEIPFDLDFSDKGYRDKLYEIFQKHPGDNFDFFLQSQILWDETMSMSIDEFLRENPDFQIIVIAGSGHLQYGSGIPLRTYRRNKYEYSILLSETEIARNISNYVLFPKPIEGATSPKLMVILREVEGKVIIDSFTPDSVSEKAGLRVGDILISIDDYEITNINDIRTHLFFKQKGDEVKVKVIRKRFLLGDKEIEFNVVL